MNQAFERYFKCPPSYTRFGEAGTLSDEAGFFKFGAEAICFGHCVGGNAARTPVGDLFDAAAEVKIDGNISRLPFAIEEVVENLRLERYLSPSPSSKSNGSSLLRHIYYGVRPLLPVAIRKHLQRLRLKGWNQVPFPQWPVDRSVDEIFELLMLFALRSQKVEKIPFIWFWPEGAPSAAILTHDVETVRGRDFCSTLMNIDDRFNFKASFQVVPERRYEVSQAYLQSITDRGFEVGVQDLNHDGSLYKSHEEFLRRVAKINAYGREWGAQGFRSAVLYRRQEWFDALEFSYDMSVPNVAHLDPQGGGCCTVMPYFNGKLVELPVTTTQDYPLFHILRDYSIDLWKQQIELIKENHGLVSFIVHPDYITDSRGQKTYETLLAHLYSLREETGLWIPTPGNINRWWRQRAQMKLVEVDGDWQIEGEGSERARIAYATEKNGRLEVTPELERAASFGNAASR